jgi:hypothetical protein
MTKDDIIKLARKAGWPKEAGNELPSTGSMNFERFANLVAAAEREECANLCEQWDASHPDVLAAAIRARGNT